VTTTLASAFGRSAHFCQIVMEEKSSLLSEDWKCA